MIYAALAVLKTDEERNALSEIYTKNIKAPPHKSHRLENVNE